MLKTFSLFVLLILPVTAIAQIQIGDIEVKSLSELFDKENESLWNDFGTFSKTDSDVWISNMPSMIIDMGDTKSIILAIKKDLNQDSVRTVIISQLNKQFGDFDELEIPGMVEYSSLEWEIEENGINYLFSMSKDKKVGSLNIIKN